MFVIFQLTPRNQPVTHTFTIFRLFPSQWLGGNNLVASGCTPDASTKNLRLSSLVVTGGPPAGCPWNGRSCRGSRVFSHFTWPYFRGCPGWWSILYIVCLETWAHQNQTSSILWHFRRNNWCWCFLWTFFRSVCKYKQRLRLVAPFSTEFCDTKPLEPMNLVTWCTLLGL